VDDGIEFAEISRGFGLEESSSAATGMLQDELGSFTFCFQFGMNFPGRLIEL
jgi:hypothetical protein